VTPAPTAPGTLLPCAFYICQNVTHIKRLTYWVYTTRRTFCSRWLDAGSHQNWYLPPLFSSARATRVRSFWFSSWHRGSVKKTAYWAGFNAAPASNSVAPPAYAHYLPKHFLYATTPPHLPLTLRCAHGTPFLRAPWVPMPFPFCKARLPIFATSSVALLPVLQHRATRAGGHFTASSPAYAWSWAFSCGSNGRSTRALFRHPLTLPLHTNANRAT